MKIINSDFLVIGTGIAGLSAAKELSQHGTVSVLTKGNLYSGSTTWAQGGIAAAMTPEDTPKLHLEDTLFAGDGLCDRQAVEILVEDGPKRVKELIELGANFDKLGNDFDFTKEAAHSKRRILHAGDATGREIEKTLGRYLLSQSNISFYPFMAVNSLVVEDGSCYGCIAVSLNNDLNSDLNNDFYFVQFQARAVVLATGGAGQLYSNNTNPTVATGDGIALAYDVGADVQDLEFMQFHPTTLYTGDKKPISLFLISEAVRGEGAFLRNIHGEKFMSEYHELAELAPRDVVSRAIFSEMDKTRSQHVYLDLTTIKKDLAKRFPTIYNRCLEAKIDISKDFIPVSPAAHYFMGGVKTDYWAQTSLNRLYAVGEVASLGIHGANRLASNSLLDGLVYGYRAANHIIESGYKAVPFNQESPQKVHQDTSLAPYLNMRHQVRHMMWLYVGILRHNRSLTKTVSYFDSLLNELDFSNFHPIITESKNMLVLAQLMTKAALFREESRGAHYRSDFPEKNNFIKEKHSVFNKDKEITYSSSSSTNTSFLLSTK